MRKDILSKPKSDLRQRKLTNHPPVVHVRMSSSQRPMWQIAALIMATVGAVIGGIIVLQMRSEAATQARIDQLERASRELIVAGEKSSAERRKADYEAKMAEQAKDGDLRNRYRAWLAQQAANCVQLSDLILMSRDYQKREIVVQVARNARFEGWAAGRQSQLAAFTLYDLNQEPGDTPMAFGFIDAREITEDKKIAYQLLTTITDGPKKNIALVRMTVAWALVEETGFRNLIIYGITMPPDQ